MKGQSNSLVADHRAKIAITTVFLTVLICMPLLSQALTIPSLTTYGVLAAGAGLGGVTSNCCTATKNANYVTSLSLAGAGSNSTTLKYITDARQLLNHALYEYQKHNYTGALVLATKAYLDNFEFVEAPLQQHDKMLEQNTEFMMRADLRDQIKHKVPLDDIKTLISKINTNLDKAEKILSSI